MPNTLEELEIVVKGNIKDAVSKLEELKDNIKGKLTTEFEKMKPAINETANEIGNFSTQTAKKIGTTSLKVVAITLAFRKMLQVATKGFGYLSQYSERFNITMSNIKSAFLQAGNSVSTAFAPVLQSLEPIIIGVANAITELFTALARINTILFTNNKTFTVAKKANTDYAKSVGKVAKANKGMLASFDELNVISEQSGSGASNGMPNPAEMFEEEEIDTSQLTGFSKWIFELKNQLSEINFEPLIDSFERLKTAIEPFTQAFFDGLYWFKDNILVPFASWTIEELIPSFLNLLASALNVLAPILEACKPILQWLLDNFLIPIAKWTGGVIIKIIDTLSSSLQKLADFLNGNTSFKEFLDNLSFGEILALAFMTAIGLLLAVVVIYNVIMGIASVVTGIFGVAVAILTSPITLVILAITALITIIILLIKYWDDVKEFASRCWEGIKNVWNSVADWFNEHVVKPISNFFGRMWDGIKTGAGKLADVIDKKVVKPIVTSFKGMYNSVIAIIEGLINGFIGIINGFLRGINGAIDLINKIPGVDLPRIRQMDKVSIPRLAQGDVLTQETLFVGGEYANAKQNPEIVAPQSLMYETNMKANIPVMNAIEEMTDTLVEALKGVGVYAEFDYDKLRVGLNNSNYRAGEKLYGV